MEKDLRHSINYITQKTKRKSGFFVPKGYLENIENDVICKLFEEKKSKRKSFETPKNYFVNLEDKILAKILSEEKTLPKRKTKIVSFKKLVPIITAASLLLFVSVYFFNNSVSSDSLDTLTIAEIENWYENEYSATDSDEFAMIFEETDFNDTEILVISFEEQDLEDYFNSAETTDLINE